MSFYDAIRVGASGAVDTYEISRSVRFDRSSSPYFSRTPSSAGNRDTWTLSCWVKKSENELYQAILYAGPSTGTNHNNTDAFAFNGSDQLFFGGEVGQSVTYSLTTNRKFRDPSAWYHIVLAVDTTQGTASNRVKLYINGVQETSFAGETYMSQNQDTFVNATNIHAIGYTSSGRTIEGYFAEYYLIDGQQLTPSSFGETDATTGQWNPKNSDDVKDNVTFGTNGFYLNFSDNSNNAAIGTDYSGNNNTWTVNNIASSHDTVPDTPTNNFCTGNYVGRTYTDSAGNTPTYSEGSLEFETAGNSTHAYGTIAVNHFLTSGCYFEVLANDLDTSRSYVGIVEPQSSSNNASYGFVDKAIVRHSFHVYGGTGIDGTSDYDAAVSDCVAGDIIGVAIKGTSVWFHKNGTYINNSSGSTGNPSTGANAAITAITDIATKHYLPYAGYNSDWTFNFGQDSTFAGEKTAQGNTDAGGIGDFYYPVPTGFKAICTKNMPNPSILLPNKHFDTLLWAGNSTNNRAITGLEFQPDFVWIKKRNVTIMSHYLVYSLAPYTDSGTGNGNVGAFVSGTNATDAEGTTTDGGFESFDSNGFTLGKGNNDGGGGDDAYQRMNVSGANYVGWNWNAGDTDGKTYTVKVVSDSGNKYRFDNFGTSAVTLDLAEGGTYIFNMDDSSNATHPFSIGTAANGTVYTSGITYFLDGVSKTYSQYTSGFAAASTRRLHITVPASAPQLYYWCSAHSGMGGAINTNSTLGSSNFDGSIQSTVKANASAGFSLVSYTGTGADGTVGHGLGVTPDAIILKNRDRSVDWVVKHKSLTSGYINYLNLNGVPDGATGGNNGIIADLSSSSNFSITRTSNSGNYNLVGVNGEDYIAYCFSSVEGYSKFGTYQTNGISGDGPFIYLGFRPAFFLHKRTDDGSSNSDWRIWDNKREGVNINPIEIMLQPNSSDADYDSANVAMDFLSNGVKVRASDTGNNVPAGGNFIYFAFAEAPFRNARAR